MACVSAPTVALANRPYARIHRPHLRRVSDALATLAVYAALPEKQKRPRCPGESVSFLTYRGIEFMMRTPARKKRDPPRGIPDEVRCAAVERNWRFFPVEQRGKKPLVRWKNAATSNINQLVELSRQFPSCNWAWAIPEGLIVLDVDGIIGRLIIRAWEGVGHVLPTTFTQRTGKGTHYAFSSNATIQNSVGKGSRQGLDVRAPDGYVG